MLRPRSGPRPLDGRPTEGPQMVRWIQGHCSYGEGDRQGEPVQLELFQKYLLHHLGELNPDGIWRYKRALWEFPKGNGKALALDTPLPTPTGWTSMGDVQVGDLLLDEAGLPQRVLEVHPVQLGNCCYQVAFSDGTRIVADAEHLWVTEELANAYAPGVRTTQQIGDSLTRADGARNHRVPNTRPLQLPAQDLPVAPYALGLWLGDGDSASARLTAGIRDLPGILRNLAATGVRTSVRPGRDDRQHRVGLLGLAPGLRALGVLGDKHIPACYLRGSIEQRLQLLRGLLDSDGTISAAGQVEFCVTNERLARGTLELVRTLGFRPVLRSARAELYGKDCGTRWRLTWTPHRGQVLFGLDRKADRQRRVGRGFRSARHITAVTAVPSVPVRCIKVAGASQLFLAGEAMVPTHNTPLNAWVLLYLLAHRRSPVIPVGASSFGQADLLYSDMKACVDSSEALQALMEAYEDRIVLKQGSGRAYKISARGGTNDGTRPSAYGADEIHELVTPEQQKAYRNTARGIVKRRDGLVLATTTPGADLDGLLGKMHVQGLKTNNGEPGGDPRLLFVWYGAPGEGINLDDPDELARLLRLANPAADLFLDVADHVALAGTMPAFEFERYHLGRWTQVLAAWLPPGAWQACLDLERAKTRTETRPGIPLGADVVLGFDGSWNGDSTALVAVDLNGMVLGVVRAWEKPEDARPDWHVPATEVEAAVRASFTDYRVRELAYDPRIWHQLFEELDAEGYPVVEVPQGQHMVDAATRFYTAVAQRTLAHDGDPRLARHVGNCVGVSTSEGVRVQKESRSSTRWIDLAIAAVMAHDHAAAVTQDAGVLVY